MSEISTRVAADSSMKKRLPCLDGLRAISIVFVLCSHGFATIHASIPAWVSLVFAHGDLGVFVFFVLSGFLITYLLKKEWMQNGAVDLRKFYWRRIARIFPAFYSYLIVITILCLCGYVHIRWPHLVQAGFFLWNYKHLWDLSGVPDDWFLGHFWTLSLEEQFYLVWPLSFALLRPSKAKWLAVVLILIEPCLRMATYFMFPNSRGREGMMLHTAADSIMFGCLLALIWDSALMARVLLRFRNPIWPILAALFPWFISPEISELLPRHVAGGYGDTLGHFLTGLSITFIIAWLLNRPRCWFGRLLDSKLFVHLGLLSYSLYLWQQLFLTSLNKTWSGMFPLNLICAYLAALISYNIIEKPFLVLKRKRFEAAHPD